MLLTWEEALAQVLAHVRPLGDESVAVQDAAGRIVAADACARIDLPPFDSSAMDGYAVRAADTPGTLSVAGQSAAGAPSPRVLELGEAIAISTGAAVPAGADAVVPVERTRGGGASVEAEAVSKGANIRPRGGDVRAGTLVVEAGERLAATQLAALAAAGVGELPCGLRPRVAVLATGSELRPPGTDLAPGQIYESNSVLLAAQCTEAGAVPDVLRPAPDEPGPTRAALEQGLAADVLLTTGGVSVGEHDLVRSTLAELGVEEVFWRVAVKPGKPVAFGVRGSTLIVGLPGNPVSSLAGFELLVRPALLALQGARRPGPAWRPGLLAVSVRRDEGRDQLVRARSRVGEAAVLLEPVSGQESHMIVRAAGADALVLVRRGTGEVAAGAAVSYLPIGWD